MDHSKDLSDAEQGARFVARFAKNRNATDDECPSLEWRFKKPEEDGRIGVSWKRLSAIELLRQCIEDGLTTLTDIAAEMETSKATACRLAAKAIKEGWLKKDGREYALVTQS